MIILNQILQETVTHIRQINKLKCDFWAKATHSTDESTLHRLFNAINKENSFGILDKNDFEVFLRLNSVRGKFVDSWFYANSTNENFMVMTDFRNYMQKYIKISETMTPELEELSVEECLRRMLNAEQKMFESLEPKKQSLMATFDHPTELFSYLKNLFEDISSFSVRNHMKIMDFQKANTKVRLNHNFNLLSASDISYLQNYFHLNCDSGISYEEFVFMLCDYVSLQTNLQSQMHNNWMGICHESFLPINIIPASMRFNINNFREKADGGSEENTLGLKALLLRGMTGKTNEMDAVYIRNRDGNKNEMSRDGVVANSFMNNSQSDKNHILQANDEGQMSKLSQQRTEKPVTGVVEVIHEPLSQQGQNLKLLPKPTAANQSGMNRSQQSQQDIRNSIQNSGPNISGVNGQLLPNDVNQSGFNLSVINKRTNQSGLNQVSNQSRQGRQLNSHGDYLQIDQSQKNGMVSKLNANQLGLNQSVRQSENQSILQGLSQISYPQINIRAQPGDIEPNSFLIPTEDSAILLNGSADLYRQNINGSILDDESDNLSQLDKTIRENILEFRY